MRTSLLKIVIGLLMACGTLSASAAQPITLMVDATDVSRKIMHARLVIPVEPGKLTLVYPKWIPGTHAPAGDIADLTGLKVTASGAPVAWERDMEDMYAFHVTVPAGAHALEVSLDFLLASKDEGGFGTTVADAQLAMINWLDVLLYPKGSAARDVQVAATLRLPAGWQYGTALPLDRLTPDGLVFRAASLETLVDSPVVAGAHVRTIDLTPRSAVAHQMNIAADSAAALEMKPETVALFSRLVAEANALFGAYHYRSYHFLVALSDNLEHFAVEHHESSDNRQPEKMFVEDDELQLSAWVLAHEFVHSWNGKYRRPADLATPDYQQPMKTDMLWVYEGLTQYLGMLLTARSGLWTNGAYHEELALAAARLDHRAGRSWRPLVDTATASQFLFFSRAGGNSWRRGADYYNEGWLIWQEADVMIRQRTHGKRSLDDFCRTFFGGDSGPPQVVTYTFDDIVAALNKIEPYDWRGFFDARVTAINPHAPLGGIEGGGWRLIYTDKMPDRLKASEGADKYTDMIYSLGIVLNDEGMIRDVIPDLPADKAGVAPGMKLLAVNGRHYSADRLRTAVKQAKTKATPAAPIEFIVENGEFFKTCAIDYHDGERYPHLERDPKKPDLLEQILKPLTASPQTAADKSK